MQLQIQSPKEDHMGFVTFAFHRCRKKVHQSYFFMPQIISVDFKMCNMQHDCHDQCKTTMQPILFVISIYCFSFFHFCPNFFFDRLFITYNMPTYQIIFIYIEIHKDKHIPKERNHATYQKDKINISQIYQVKEKHIHLSLISRLTVQQQNLMIQNTGSWV